MYQKSCLFTNKIPPNISKHLWINNLPYLREILNDIYAYTYIHMYNVYRLFANHIKGTNG